MLSGVPQGSVLEPCLFLFYINDIPDNLKSTVRLFAYDTIVHFTVSFHTYAEILQSDLRKLEEWGHTWQMEFHPGKCQVITICRHKNPTQYSYQLHGQMLARVSSAKYLGITIQQDLRWNEHISNITTKAKQLMPRLPTTQHQNKIYYTQNLSIRSPRSTTS